MMMNRTKHTWHWVMIAAGLFAFIFFIERHWQEPDSKPALVLPALKTSAVTSVLVRAGQLEVRVERTNDTWQLTSPMAYPAQAASIENLLAALEHLAPATCIKAAELRGRPKVDEEYGFNNPQALLTLQQHDYQGQLLIGACTAPGDQVFVQVVGAGDIYVVDAGLLKLLPRSVTDWRDTSLVDLPRLEFDRLVVTSSGVKVLELQRNATNHYFWRMTSPLQARANNVRIAEALEKLQALRVLQFVSDDARADLDAFGLKPAELELALARGTNPIVLVQFGKNATNDASQVYARRQGLNAIVAVSGEPLKVWRASARDFPVNDFRDPHLVTVAARADEVEVHGLDDFTLQRQGSSTWRIVSRNFPVDAGLADEFVNDLSALQVAQFVKDVVTEPDLPVYGLANPARQITLKSAPVSGQGATNAVIAQLSFGATQEDKVYVRRTDEDFVYAVRLADFQRLPWASWRLRERQIWNFTTNDVARLTVRQGGKTWQVVRNGPVQWSLAPGSQGMINDLAIEEVACWLGQLAANAWIERGDQNLARHGFTASGDQITVELKNGGKLNVEFGGLAPSQYPCAAVVLDGQTWIFEFPPALFQLIQNYLTISAKTP